MPADDRQREYRREMLLASLLIAAGLAASALALTALTARDPLHIAQATPPTQSTPGAETKPPAPAEPAKGRQAFRRNRPVPIRTRRRRAPSPRCRRRRRRRLRRRSARNDPPAFAAFVQLQNSWAGENQRCAFVTRHCAAM